MLKQSCHDMQPYGYCAVIYDQLHLEHFTTLYALLKISVCILPENWYSQYKYII